MPITGAHNRRQLVNMGNVAVSSFSRAWMEDIVIKTRHALSMHMGGG